MICWEPVVLDCAGGIEATLTYRHESAYIRVIGTQPCLAGDPTSGDCPVYRLDPFNILQESMDACVQEPALPGIGEILLMKVTAIDATGNEDCGA